MNECSINHVACHKNQQQRCCCCLILLATINDDDDDNYRPDGNYGLFQVWETLLQEVEVDSALVAQVANCLSGRRSSGGGGGGGVNSSIANDQHRKLEARKIFQHRQLLESALDKAAQQLEKVNCNFLFHI